MVEFRLYYDDNGDCICYTCEDLEGNYLVIDSQTFAEGRHDVKVIDGKLVKPSSRINIVKLVVADEGVTCAEDDISIIVDKEYIGPVLKWKEKLYESRRY
jgi:hypothetical protein